MRADRDLALAIAGILAMGAVGIAFLLVVVATTWR